MPTWRDFGILESGFRPGTKIPNKLLCTHPSKGATHEKFTRKQTAEGDLYHQVEDSCEIP